jgi:hypothetical protein
MPLLALSPAPHTARIRLDRKSVSWKDRRSPDIVALMGDRGTVKASLEGAVGIAGLRL